MLHGNTKRIVVGSGSAEDYAYSIVRLVGRGTRKFRLQAVGENICKLAETVAMLPTIFPGEVRVVEWRIDSKKIRGERRSVLEVEIVLEPPS